jgi:hypothetical protein
LGPSRKPEFLVSDNWQPETETRDNKQLQLRNPLSMPLSMLASQLIQCSRKHSTFKSPIPALDHYHYIEAILMSDVPDIYDGSIGAVVFVGVNMQVTNFLALKVTSNFWTLGL